MGQRQIEEVIVDALGHLQVRPQLSSGNDYSFIYRDASGITWLPDRGVLAAREPDRWEAFELFSQIVQAVRNEYGEYLVVSPQTRWTNVSTELRAKIRALHLPHFEAVATAGGTNPWITMVHGASQHSGLFSAQVEAFQPDYRLLLIDLPGHGRSSAMPGPYGLVGYARSVLAAIRAAGVERTHFWGTHTGAGIGLMLAAQHPELIASLVLDGAILPGIDLPYVTARLAVAKKTARERGVEAARAEWFRESGWFDVIREKPEECRTKEHWNLIAGFSGRPWLDASAPEPVPSIRPQLARIEQPVLLVNGEHDVEDFIRVADELESSLKNVQRVTVPKAGGFPLWEFPAEVNSLVRQFLGRHGPNR